MTRSTAGQSGHVARGVLCSLLGGVFWGFSGTCAQLLMQSYGIPALWITCVRLLIAAFCFLIVIAVRDRHTLISVFHDRRSLVVFVVFAIFGVVLVQVSYLNSIKYVGAGTATVIEQLALIIIMFFVCVKTLRLPNPREVIGLIVALAGMFVIATQGDIGVLALPPEGLFWGLVSAVAVACYTLIPVNLLKKWGSMIVTCVSMLFGGILTTIVVQPWAISVTFDLTVVVVLAAIVLVGTVAAYLLYLQGIADAGPVRASLLCCVEPVSATILSFVWLHTAVSVYDIVGCALILGMVFLVTQREKNVYDQPINAAVLEDKG